MKKVAFYTFGCKVNQYETEKLKNIALKNNWEIVPLTEDADIYFINSCAVTHIAERKARRLISFIKRHHPNSVIVLAGCYSERLKLSSESLNVDYIIDNKEKWKFFGDDDSNSFINSEDRARALLKIQDGCSNFCSYCIVPFLRGKEKSRPINEVITEAELLIEQGFKEIILTGIRLGAYGHDLGETDGLYKLLLRLFDLSGLEKIRLSSIEPMDITDSLIELANHPKMCIHWHIPLQSGDDEILRKMNRKYDTKYFESIIEKLREKNKDIAITTDVIVGYPEEKDKNFLNSYEFIKRLGFMRIHVFPYSPRPFTISSKLKPLPNEVINERKEKLLKLSKDLWENYVKKFIGRELLTMVEKREGDIYKGTTDNYIKIEFKSNIPLKEGEYVRVKLRQMNKEKEKVLGDLVEEKLKATL